MGYEICDMRYMWETENLQNQSIMRQIIIRIGLQQQEKGQGDPAPRDYNEGENILFLPGLRPIFVAWHY